MRIPRVYVVQERPGLEISKAERYGILIPVFPEHDQMYDPDAARKRIMRLMGNFTERDYILAVGHPTAIAAVTAAAARMNGGRFKMLVWHPDDRLYYSVQWDLGAVPNREVTV